MPTRLRMHPRRCRSTSQVLGRTAGEPATTLARLKGFLKLSPSSPVGADMAAVADTVSALSAFGGYSRESPQIVFFPLLPPAEPHFSGIFFEVRVPFPAASGQGSGRIGLSASSGGGGGGGGVGSAVTSGGGAGGGGGTPGGGGGGPGAGQGSGSGSGSGGGGPLPAGAAALADGDAITVAAGGRFDRLLSSVWCGENAAAFARLSPSLCLSAHALQLSFSFSQHNNLCSDSLAPPAAVNSPCRPFSPSPSLSGQRGPTPRPPAALA